MGTPFIHALIYSLNICEHMNVWGQIKYLSILVFIFIVEGIHKVIVQDAKGSLHTLNRYYAMWNKPRPESSTIVRVILLILLSNCCGMIFFWITNLFVIILKQLLTLQDSEIASKLSNTCEKRKLYRELASTAESGWDFSTRWMT